MSCQQMEDWLVSDDARDLEAARRHAEGCANCAELLAEHESVLAAARAWRQSEPSLRDEFVANLEARLETPRPVALFRAHPEQEDGRRSWRRAALAASVLTVLGLGNLLYRITVPQVPAEAQGALLAYDALGEVRRAEQEHARAVAKLEEAVRPLLARADDAATPAAEAAVLIAYRDRLRHVERGIGRVGSYLEENPYHSKARAQLLAGYSEKAQVLREILNRPNPKARGA
jgi:hypothetical protein